MCLIYLAQCRRIHFLIYVCDILESLLSLNDSYLQASVFSMCIYVRILTYE